MKILGGVQIPPLPYFFLSLHKCRCFSKWPQLETPNENEINQDMSGSDVAGNRKELEQKLVSLGSTDKDDRAQTTS